MQVGMVVQVGLVEQVGLVVILCHLPWHLILLIESHFLEVML